MKRVLIVGAGAAGQMIVNEMLHNHKAKDSYEVVGFLDDNENAETNSLPLLGKICQLREKIPALNIDLLLIAIPTANSQLIERILSDLDGINIEVKIIPGLIEIIDGNASYNQAREIEPSDLLGREEVTFDIEKITPYYKNKTVFITGAGGSIGSEILRQLLSLPIKKLVALGHGENSIHSVLQAIGKDPRFEYVIGDVKDKAKLQNSIKKHKPDIIFHAAAHKHVPLMETHPDEAIKNNILGTYQVAKVAREFGVAKFVLISTDKAVNPTSVMGASKRIAEQLILSMNKTSTTEFVLTRFGNVLGSRGSVVTVFNEQIKHGGPLTVTDPKMTRFFMSIREAARLVIKATTLTTGNIFILDMGRPVKIVDLAHRMIQLHGYQKGEIPVVFSGIRAGEKLYEEVLTNSEQLSTTDYEKLLVSQERTTFYPDHEIENVVAEFLEVGESYDVDKIRDYLISKVCK